jgi:hypothetical protein
VTDKEGFKAEGRAFVPPPKDFDLLTAGPKDLVRYGLPRRPDPLVQPELSSLWERQARRYRTFEHLQAKVHRSVRNETAAAPEVFRLFPVGTCGYTLDGNGDTFTVLATTWTVPNLRYTPSALGINNFRTFVGLGFLDVHVEMTVDTTHNVTAIVTALGPNGMERVGLPVQPGDVVSAVMCLAPKPPGESSYILANETRSQTVNIRFDSGFPPAASINAGISRDVQGNPSQNALAHFGVVYFDEIIVFAAGGNPALTDGHAVAMVDTDGTTLAKPIRLNGSAFKIVRND